MRFSRTIWCSASAAGIAIAAGFGVSGCEKDSPVVGTDGRPIHSIPRTLHYIHRVYTLDVGTESVCLDRELPLPTDFGPSCSLFSVRRGEGDCTCDGPGRSISIDGKAARIAVLRDAGFLSEGLGVDDFCVCEVSPASTSDVVACQGEVDVPTSSTGWCAVLPEQGLGSSEVSEDCNGGPMLRFLGDARPTLTDSTFVLACLGPETVDFQAPPADGRVGDPCMPSLEGSVHFRGAYAPDLAVETKSPACGSGVCLSNHFQGRVSCPYGQTLEETKNAPACFVPWSDAPVAVPVQPQLVGRPPDQAAFCSCMCQGPDVAVAYCDCPADMECASGPEWTTGYPGDYGDVTGKFCIPKGSQYDLKHPPDGEVCDRELMNCGDARPF